MIDLNTAEVQGSGNGGPIPEDSIVPFKMNIRPPKSGKEGSHHALFCKSGKGNEFIDVEFEAMGSHAGTKIWENYTLVGSDTAAKISMRTLRAIVESARGISPKDDSTQASAGRVISDWYDFNGMQFLAKVSTVIEQDLKTGDNRIRNHFKKIITPDDPEYAAGECISDKPLPVVTAGAVAPKPPAAGPAPAWGAPTAGPLPHSPVTPPPPPAGAQMPAWASR